MRHNNNDLAYDMAILATENMNKTDYVSFVLEQLVNLDKEDFTDTVLEELTPLIRKKLDLGLLIKETTPDETISCADLMYNLASFIKDQSLYSQETLVKSVIEFQRED